MSEITPTPHRAEHPAITSVKEMLEQQGINVEIKKAEDGEGYVMHVPSPDGIASVVKFSPQNVLTIRDSNRGGEEAAAILVDNIVLSAPNGTITTLIPSNDRGTWVSIVLFDVPTEIIMNEEGATIMISLSRLTRGVEGIVGLLHELGHRVSTIPIRRILSSLDIPPFLQRREEERMAWEWALKRLETILDKLGIPTPKKKELMQRAYNRTKEASTTYDRKLNILDLPPLEVLRWETDKRIKIPLRILQAAGFASPIRQKELEEAIEEAVRLGGKRILQETLSIYPYHPYTGEQIVYDDGRSSTFKIEPDLLLDSFKRQLKDLTN